MSDPIEVARRPYRLKNQIQHYAWGTRGADALIPKLLGQEPELGTPYAELWMGAHPNAPSRVVLPDGTEVTLPALIDADPEGTLGPEIRDRFGGLPFLFKVLSAAKALSIQAHPNREQAERLHAEDPQHYPDPNHKPEIAVALGGLTALIGFKPFEELGATLKRYPEIAAFIGDTARRVIEVKEAAPEQQKALTYELFRALLTRAEEDEAALVATLDRLVARLSTQVEGVTDAELWFLEVQRQYGSRDVGVVAFFLFNLVQLGPGEGVNTRAGVPHAYLRGDIIECMANSDNVVRVGLTPKHRDAKTLLEIVDAMPGAPEILRGTPPAGQATPHLSIYRTPAPEFELRRWQLGPGIEERVGRGQRPTILLVIEGSVELSWESGKEVYERGASAFLPACLAAYTMRAPEGAVIFEATVPRPDLSELTGES